MNTDDRTTAEPATGLEDTSAPSATRATASTAPGGDTSAPKAKQPKMGRPKGKHPREALSAARVRALIAKGEPCVVADGDGLYLIIRPNAAAKWAWRAVINGKRRELGVGGQHVTLAEARERARELSRQRRAGIDVLAQRRAERASAKRTAEGSTFQKVAADYIASQRPGWRNAKHADQWANTLETYAYPVIGALPVAEVTTQHVLDILNRGGLWLNKTETATRVRGRLEKVMDYAEVHGLREGKNPAQWRGHLDQLLPPPRKVTKVEHQRALPWAEAPELAAAVRGMNTHAARALLLTLLCATRTSETLEARWQEIDLDAALWTIPAERMKAGKAHRVALSGAAVALLQEQQKITGTPPADAWVFPGQKRGRPLSNMALLNVLKRLGLYERTSVHGLRSTFRDWVADATSYPDRLAEMALAHQLGDKVEAAYRRTDQLERRRDMMDAWAQHLSQKQGADVIDINAKQGRAQAS